MKRPTSRTIRPCRFSSISQNQTLETSMNGAEESEFPSRKRIRFRKLHFAGFWSIGGRREHSTQKVAREKVSSLKELVVLRRTTRRWGRVLELFSERNEESIQEDAELLKSPTVALAVAT
jgi:hypothetical protein